MCLSADWAGMLALSNSLCIVLCCVFGFVALSCASALALFCRPCFGWSVASVLPVWFSFRFSFRGAAGLLSFAAAVRLVVGCRLCLFVVSVSLGCVRFGSLFPCFPLPSPPPLWLVLCAFWSSQCSAGPSLRVSGCICNGPVVIPSIWRVVADWLLSSLLLMATKASALCGLCPLHHVVGVVQVPLAPALRYSPLGDPETP